MSLKRFMGMLPVNSPAIESQYFFLEPRVSYRHYGSGLVRARYISSLEVVG